MYQAIDACPGRIIVPRSRANRLRSRPSQSRDVRQIPYIVHFVVIYVTYRSIRHHLQIETRPGSVRHGLPLRIHGLGTRHLPSDYLRWPKGFRHRKQRLRLLARKMLYWRALRGQYERHRGSVPYQPIGAGPVLRPVDVASLYGRDLSVRRSLNAQPRVQRKEHAQKSKEGLTICQTSHKFLLDDRLYGFGVYITIIQYFSSLKRISVRTLSSVARSLVALGSEAAIDRVPSSLIRGPKPPRRAL